MELIAGYSVLILLVPLVTILVVLIIYGTHGVILLSKVETHLQQIAYNVSEDVAGETCNNTDDDDFDDFIERVMHD